jgi:hypothetical protein
LLPTHHMHIHTTTLCYRKPLTKFPPGLQMAIFTRAVRFKRPTNTVSAVKAARVIRSIKSRYRTQAFLFLAYHFFLTSFVHLDIFIIFFILVSNFMNRDQDFTSRLLMDGLRFLLDERRIMLP